MIAVPLATIGELAVPGVILGALGLLLIGIVAFWDRFRPSKPVVTAVEPVESVPLAIAPMDATGPVMAFARTITWPAAIDPDAGALDEPERRYVIDGLAVVGDAWSAAILAQAFDEEQGDLRLAVIEALGQCVDGDVAPTLERAYASHVVGERYAAIDGASRRGDVALLERGLRDTDGTVALAAAYGLHRAQRDEMIEDALEGRDDARANEIRRILPMLAGV